MTTRPARRVALLGAFGVDNYGNDETLETSIAGVRDAAQRAGVDVELVCVCSDVEGVEARSGLPTLPLAGTDGWGSSSRLAPVRFAGRIPQTLQRLVRAVRDLRHVDLLCIAGTGTLDDQLVGPGSLPLDVALWSVAARLAGTHLVFASAGAGPIDHWASKPLYRTAARCARQVSYRDERSKDYMRGVGRNVDHDTVVPDLVFGRRQVVPEATSAGGRPRVALGVLWSGYWPSAQVHNAYLDRLVDVVRALWDAGFDVTLIEGDEDDRPAVAELAGRLGDDGVGRAGQLCVPHIRSFDDVLAAVAPCAVTVASRYHNLVAAFLVGRPVVSLEYGFKNSALMEEFGLGDFCHRITDFVPARVVEHVQQLAGDDSFATRCLGTVEEMRRAVDEQWEELVQ
jgi:polysaccharide pyruvyl transferase WcaK-like protein